MAEEKKVDAADEQLDEPPRAFKARPTPAAVLHGPVGISIEVDAKNPGAERLLCFGRARRARRLRGAYRG